jgi:hypothetical protein
MFACKDGLGQTIVPGTKLLSMTSNGPRLYTVSSITWYANGNYSITAYDDKTRSRVGIKKLSRYLAFDPTDTQDQNGRRVSHKIADALAAAGR